VTFYKKTRKYVLPTLAWVGTYPIGHTSGMFSVSANLLVTLQECSRCPPRYWLYIGNVLVVCHPIGHLPEIFTTGAMRGQVLDLWQLKS
jgi:hypothetical protein